LLAQAETLLIYFPEVPTLLKFQPQIEFLTEAFRGFSLFLYAQAGTVI
jgi:hypothetical protein